MARSFNGTNQYLSAASTLLGNEPIDMVAHFSSNNTTAEQAIVSLGDNGSFGAFALLANGAAAGDPVSE